MLLDEEESESDNARFRKEDVEGPPTSRQCCDSDKMNFRT